MSEQSARVAQRTGWLTFNLRWLLVVAAAVLVLSDPAPASMLANGRAHLRRHLQLWANPV